MVCNLINVKVKTLHAVLESLLLVPLAVILHLPAELFSTGDL